MPILKSYLSFSQRRTVLRASFIIIIVLTIAYFVDTSNFQPDFQFVSPSVTSRYRRDNTIYVNPLIGTSGAGYVARSRN